MSRSGRRLLIMLALIVWLLIMLTPTFAALLARNGQLTIGDLAGPHTRLFLLQAPDAEGLGLERTQRVRPPARTLRCRHPLPRSLAAGWGSVRAPGTQSWHCCRTWC
jgi:hypothetical protein